MTLARGLRFGRLIAELLFITIVGACAAAAAGAEQAAIGPRPDPDALRDLVVLANGRQKPLRTHAEETLVLLFGTPEPAGQDPLEAYLGALFDTESFLQSPSLTPGGELAEEVFEGKVRVSPREVFAARDRLVEIANDAGTPAEPGVPAGEVDARRLAQLETLRAQTTELFDKASRVAGLGDDFRVLPNPAAAGEEAAEEWLDPSAARRALEAGAESLRPGVEALEGLEAAFLRGDQAAFDRHADTLKRAQRALAAHADGEAAVISPALVRIELLFYAVDFKTVGLLIFAASLLAFAVRLCWKSWRPAGIAAFVLLAAGILWNCWIMTGYTAIAGRLPLRNLQEVYLVVLFFVPLIGVLLSILLRSFLYCAVAAFLTAVGFVGAHFLPAEGYMIAPLVAILHSPWREVHILTIMFSYAVLLVALGMHATFLGMVLVTPGARRNVAGRITYSENARDLERKAYHLVAWGFLFLTIGIATGAAWGHSAWGRYWGWDPKEVWATVAWAIYAVLLHLRLFYRPPKEVLAAISIAGYAAILFTFFGVSYLLPGLHAYR